MIDLVPRIQERVIFAGILSAADKGGKAILSELHVGAGEFLALDLKLQPLLLGCCDFLLECMASPKNRLHNSARRAFINTWESANASQLDKFIQSQVYLTTSHRAKFPAKVGVH